MADRSPRNWGRCELALGILYAVGFLACVGGPAPRERDIEGTWSGSMDEKTREVSHDLRLEIDRADWDEDEVSARVTLDGETVDAYQVRSGSKRTVRIWYEFPSGRKGRVRGRVNNSGWLMRGVLRLEEGGEVYAPRFELAYVDGLEGGYGSAAVSSGPAPEPASPGSDPVDPGRYDGGVDPEAEAPEPSE